LHRLLPRAGDPASLVQPPAPAEAPRRPPSQTQLGLQPLSVQREMAPHTCRRAQRTLARTLTLQSHLATKQRNSDERGAKAVRRVSWTAAAACMHACTASCLTGGKKRTELDDRRRRLAGGSPPPDVENASGGSGSHSPSSSSSLSMAGQWCAAVAVAVVVGLFLRFALFFFFSFLLNVNFFFFLLFFFVNPLFFPMPSLIEHRNLLLCVFC
jgi:hypothetical protein